MKKRSVPVIRELSSITLTAVIGGAGSSLTAAAVAEATLDKSAREDRKSNH